MRGLSHARRLAYGVSVGGEASIADYWSQLAGAKTCNAHWSGYRLSARTPTPNGVAWPPRGFVPYQMLPARSNLWSLSYPDADFSAATVTMAIDGSSFAVALEEVRTGSGDNTIVWRPFIGSPGVSYAPPTGADSRYAVNIGNVRGSGVPTSFAYEVIVFDPTDALFGDGFE